MTGDGVASPCPLAACAPKTKLNARTMAAKRRVGVENVMFLMHYSPFLGIGVPEPRIS
jgi:hypothetical protein